MLQLFLSRVGWNRWVTVEEVVNRACRAYGAARDREHLPSAVAHFGIMTAKDRRAESHLITSASPESDTPFPSASANNRRY